MNTYDVRTRKNQWLKVIEASRQEGCYLAKVVQAAFRGHGDDHHHGTDDRKDPCGRELERLIVRGALRHDLRPQAQRKRVREDELEPRMREMLKNKGVRLMNARSVELDWLASCGLIITPSPSTAAEQSNCSPWTSSPIDRGRPSIDGGVGCWSRRLLS